MKRLSHLVRHALRTMLVETFEDELSGCFSLTIAEILGKQVAEEIYHLLNRAGIPTSEVPRRFDDVVQELTRVLGGGTRVLVYKTLVRLYEEYSVRPTFGINDSLKQSLTVLKEKVLAELLKPKHSQAYDDSFYVIAPIR